MLTMLIIIGSHVAGVEGSAAWLFSCLPFSYLTFIQIIYAVNRQGKRAAQWFGGQRL